MPDPANKEEYLARFHKNTRITGYGLEVTQVVPCPFCAAPDFARWRPVQGILPNDTEPNLDAQMRAEATCSECGRSGRHIVERDASGVMAEFVQTGGDDPPPWLQPVPRRV